jgi:rabankyrin-5
MPFTDDTFASLLVKRGASLDAIDTRSNESLLHKCARHHYQSAGIYLVEQGVTVNHWNKHGETALHLASQYGLETLTRTLLKYHADPNMRTNATVSTSDDDNIRIGLQTPVHRAIYARQENLLDFYINNRERTIEPNFNLQDEHGQSVFSLTLWMNMLTLAKQLLDSGQATVNIQDCEQMPLLAQAISKQNVPAALFLLEQNVDIDEQTHGLRPIQLAVQYHLPSVVEALCRHGAMMNVIDENSNSVLWNALDSGQEDIATILVKFGCDSTQYDCMILSEKFVMLTSDFHFIG